MKRRLVLIISLIQLFNLSCLFAMQQEESFHCALLAQVPQESVVQKNKEEKHALFLRAIRKNKQEKFIKLLNDPDLKINEKDKDGWAPLHLAVYMKNADAVIVRMLLANKKIEINEKDKDGWTPLHLAINLENADIVRILLADKRIDINQKDGYGWTPLILAINLENADIVKMLLAEKNIGINQKDKDGNTPLDLARLSGNKYIIEMLEQKQESTLARLFEKIMNPFRFAGQKGISILRGLGKLRSPMPKIGIIKWVCSIFGFGYSYAS